MLIKHQVRIIHRARSRSLSESLSGYSDLCNRLVHLFALKRFDIELNCMEWTKLGFVVVLIDQMERFASRSGFRLKSTRPLHPSQDSVRGSPNRPQVQRTENSVGRAHHPR